MAFIDGTGLAGYPTTIEFSEEQLLAVTPSHVSRWMKNSAYGTPTPGPTDHPTHCRSTLLEQSKKAISWFMPNKHMPWDVRSNSGNPTRSIPVNDVIKDVKKAEVRKQGRPSQAKRDLKRAEFRKTLRVLEADEGNYELQSKVPAMLKFQFHIIARTDDITNLETNDLRSHVTFGTFALQTKVSWSKNVMEERECPDQILVGAADTDFCVILALSCYLESRLTAHQQGRFLFGDRDNDEEPDRINSRYCGALRKCWKNPEFVELLTQVKGSLGSHSVRKFPATWCSEHGCPDNEVEVRGRWKGKKNGSVVNRYINVEQLTTDAKLAGVLAVGGPIRYKLKEDSHVSNHFLTHIVVPKIDEHFVDPSNTIANVLSLPLLWACHEPSLVHMMSDAVRARVQEGYNTIRGGQSASYNPVMKVPLHISRIENQVFIEEALTVGIEGAPIFVGGDGAAQAAATTQLHINQQQTVLLAINRMDQRQANQHQQVCAEISGLRSYCSSQFALMSRNMSRYSMQPVRRIGPANPNAATGTPRSHFRNEGIDATAKLAPHPRTLLLLWHEYLFGLEGNKPARNFTSTERGTVKFKFCRRNNFWTVMARLINGGFTELTAIDKVHQAYGNNLSVTSILNKMQKDKRNGGHPNLNLH
jgi:hypothetical protein